MSNNPAFRPFLALFTSALLLGPATGRSPAPQDNVLLIVADDLGVDAIGAYAEGTDLPSTPILDELARNGVLFRRAYGCPNCSPTRATIQTGRYGFRTGIGSIVWTANAALSEAEVTLPEMLDLGTGGLYAHGAIGKWHLGNGSVGGLSSANAAGYGSFSGTLFGIVPPETYFNWTKVVNGVAGPMTKYATTDTVDDALSWISGASEPWFLYLAPDAPHSPYHVPPPALATLKPSDKQDSPRKFYKAMVEALDKELGRLVSSIPPAVRARTTIVLTSDNGTPGEVIAPPYSPFRAKNTIYEAGIRVPLIVWGSQVVQPGREVAALVNTTDLFATVAGIAGVDPAGLGLPALDSVSIQPYLADPAQAPLRQTVYSEHFEPNGPAAPQWTRAMRNDTHKLILRSNGSEELYDLSVDPRETSPLPIGQLSSLQQASYDDLKLRIQVLSPGPATALALAVVPAAQEQEGAAFSYFAVEVLGPWGTRVHTDDSTRIDLTLQSGAGALGGTLSRTVRSGVAVFDDVTYDMVETITLQAQSFPGTTVLSSAAIDVRAGPPSARATARVSVSSPSAEGNGPSGWPSASGDGRYVAFQSTASNLVAGDTNAMQDVFVRDVTAGTTARVSVDSNGNEADGDSFDPAISQDGRFVAFESVASDLVAGDTNAASDVFVHDRQTGVTTRVSVDSLGQQGDGDSQAPSITAAGRYVAFESEATNLVAGDMNLARDVFLHDLFTGKTERVSIDALGGEGNGDSRAAAVSAGGGLVAFESSATNLVAGDANAKDDIFVRDRAAGRTERASVDSLGGEGNGDSRAPSISADGRVVAFESAAANLVAGDTNAKDDVFVRDLAAGLTTRASVDSSGSEVSGDSTGCALSADGDRVLFQSTAADLVCGDTNLAQDVFLHMRSGAGTIRLSLGAAFNEPNAGSSAAAISADGRQVAFGSSASNLVSGEANLADDVFLTSLAGIEVRVSATDDDAEDRSKNTNLSSSDLELGDGGGNEAEGMRFAGVAVPRGAAIIKSWIEFQVDEVSTDPTSIVFAGEDVDDAPAFTSLNGSVTGRALTSATVPWSNIPAWSTVGAKQSSPDLTPIIQEIVGRPGWVGCNALAIIVTGTGSRVAESFDGMSTAAPLLHVEFSL